MNIAIIGNGVSAKDVDWYTELKNIDIVVRIKLGNVKNLYNINNFNLNHYSILNAFCFEEQMTYIDRVFMLKKYKKIYFIDYNLKCNNVLEFINRNISFPCNKCLLKLFIEKIEVISYFNFFLKNKKIIYGFNNVFTEHLEKRDKKTSVDVDLLDKRYPKLLEEFLFSKKLKFPSTGLFSILFIKNLYPNDKIKIYGFDSNSGWYWEPSHKADSVFCDWQAEKKFIKSLNLFK